MPELSRFYGIVVKMYYDDHPPPHFHAEYAGREMLVNIVSLVSIHGSLSPRATGMVLEWAAQHQAELLAAWRQVQGHLPLTKIDPLP
jgi:hypothetical protein